MDDVTQSDDTQHGSDSAQSRSRNYLTLLIALLPIIGFLVDYLTYHAAEYMPAIITLAVSGIYAIYAATKKSKTFLAFYSALFLVSAIGTPALTTAYHYYFVSSDYATPMVGFAEGFISGVIALLFIVIAWIVKIVGERKKLS